MAAGENSGGHCHRGLVGLVAPPARIVLRDTIGWQDCFLQKPEKKKQQKQKQQSEREKLKEIYGVLFAVVYLDVKLQIPLVHLSGDHTLNHVHWHQLIALIGWTEDIMSITFLNLDIEEPFPACSAKLVSTGHVHWIFKHRDRAETDSTLEVEKHILVTLSQLQYNATLFLLCHLKILNILLQS